MYAVYPIQDPQTTRYPTAARLFGAQVACFISPFNRANIKFPAPAAVTCQAVAPNTSIPDCHFFDSTEPSAQLNDPPIRLREANSSFRPRLPACRSGQTSTNNPARPRASPILPRPEM